MFRRKEVVFLCADPARLRAALEALDRAGRGWRWTVAPDPGLLEAALGGRRALVVADPGLLNGAAPRVERLLKEAVSLEAFLADPRGCLRKGRPLSLGAVPPGVYVVTGAAGGVGTTAAALGLFRALRAGGPALLLELAGTRRPPALPARGLGRDGSGLLLGEPWPEADEAVFGLGGRVLAEALRSRGEGPVAGLVAEAAARFRYVVVDLGADLPLELVGPFRGGFVLADPRPEALDAARTLSPPLEPVLVAPALSGAALRAGFPLRLAPPPDPGRWGRVLAQRLLRRL